MPKPSPTSSRTGSTLYLRERERLRKRAKRNGEPCWLCSRPIDWTAPANTPHAFEADHAISHADGGSDRLDNLRPSHHLCNRRRGRKAITHTPTSRYGFRNDSGAWNPTTRDWFAPGPAAPEPEEPSGPAFVHTTRGAVPVPLTPKETPTRDHPQ